MLIPNTNRKPISKELMMERWKALANDGRSTLNESTTPNASRATLMHKATGADGLTYGILQENSHFFLKKSTKSLNEATSVDFEYIGGTQNILAERFNSVSDAYRRLNAKLYALNEAVGAAAPDQEADLLNKLNQKDDEVVAPEGGVPAEAGAEDPLAGLEAGGAPAPDAGVPAPDAPAPEAGGEDPLAGLEAGLDGGAPAPDAGAAPEAGLEGGAPAEDGAADDLGAGEAGAEGAEGAEGGEGGEDVTAEAQKTLGKLGQQMGLMGDGLSVDFLQNALNTIITKGEHVFPQMTPEDKEKLQQRISKDGKKIEETAIAEDIATPGAQVAPQGGQPAAQQAPNTQGLAALKGKEFEIPGTTGNGKKFTLPFVIEDIKAEGSYVNLWGGQVTDTARLRNIVFSADHGTLKVQGVGFIISSQATDQKSFGVNYDIPADLIKICQAALPETNQVRQFSQITVMPPGSKMQEQTMDESFDAARDAQYNQYQNKLDTQTNSSVPSYEQFMDQNGFGKEDDDIIKGLAAFSSKLYELDAKPTEADLQQIAQEMNPYIWSNMGSVSQEIIDGVAKIGGVDMNGSGEWPTGGGGQVPLNESAVAKLTRLLVRSEILKGRV